MEDNMHTWDNNQIREFYDNIEVTSTVVVPEPGVTLLGSLGLLALLLRRRR